MTEYEGTCSDGHRAYYRIEGAATFGRCPVLLQPTAGDWAEHHGELPPSPVPCGQPAELVLVEFREGWGADRG